jgi:hypothetical protein
MCKLDINLGGYKLESGKFVTPDNVEELSKEELKELLNTQTTVWDFLMLRKSHHNLVNSVNNILSRVDSRIENIEEKNEEILNYLKKLEDSLTITIKNGKATKRDIREVIVELWDLHKVNRDRQKLKEILKKYKMSLFFGFLFVFLFAIFKHELINSILGNIKEFLIAGVSAGLVISLLIGVIKAFINHKKE